MGDTVSREVYEGAVTGRREFRAAYRRAMARAAILTSALRNVEWVEFGSAGETYCPCCQAHRKTGHRGGCGLHEAFGDLDAPREAGGSALPQSPEARCHELRADADRLAEALRKVRDSAEFIRGEVWDDSVSRWEIPLAVVDSCVLQALAAHEALGGGE